MPRSQLARIEAHDTRPSPRTILLVHDGGPRARTIHALLEQAGHRVLMARGRGEADAILTREQVHLILVDVDEHAAGASCTLDRPCDTARRATRP